MTIVEVSRGDSPVVLAMPHSGTDLPGDMSARLNDVGHALADTDWHIHTLYAGLLANATQVRATVHRYVIDANRDPSGESLYPGQNTTGLCPLTDFDGMPIYRDGLAPDAAEIDRRRTAFHTPYHAALAAEIEQVRARHGIAVLYDCHSIRSRIPHLFDGTLPDFNIGTNDGTSCHSRIEKIAHELAASSPYLTVLNGRFKGGWTTRHYGKPKTGVHAIQMEISQSAYLTREAAPWDYDERKANKLRRWLRDMLEAISGEAMKLSMEQEK